MKKYLLLQLVFFLFFSFGYTQEKTIFKAWISKNLDYVKIDSNLTYFEMAGSFHEEKRFFIMGDTLRLYDKYTSSRDNYSRYHIDNFDFLIKKLTSEKLILIPIDSNAKEIAKGKKVLKYIDRNRVLNKNFKFHQLKYSVYGGGWGWTDTSLSIDNKGNFQYINKSVRNKPEYFNATLSTINYNELIRLLKSSEIDKLKAFEQSVYDVPETTLEIEYNGKSKQIKQFIFPFITKELTLFLSHLPKEISLNKTL